VIDLIVHGVKQIHHVAGLNTFTNQASNGIRQLGHLLALGSAKGIVVLAQIFAAHKGYLGPNIDHIRLRHFRDGISLSAMI
jgi:hypothetical protein